VLLLFGVQVPKDEVLSTKEDIIVMRESIMRGRQNSITRSANINFSF